MFFLEEHFNAIEKVLLFKSKIAKNAGHTLHKGNARENFIKEFLEDHIASTIKIGTGEIIDCNSRADVIRNQIDIVLYNASFPKINYAKDVDAFLVESVNTTIEVKSKLSKEELKKAIIAANNIKKLSRNVNRYVNAQKTVPLVYIAI